MISSYISIGSSDGNRFTISGNDSTRIFLVEDAGWLNLRIINLTNGVAATGGAIQVDQGGDLDLLFVNISNSRATNGSGGAVNHDGRTSPTQGCGCFTMDYTVINNNSASQHGGGIAVEGWVQFHSNVISNNTAGSGFNGGGIYVANPNRWIGMTKLSVYGNSATNGGGIYIADANPLVVSAGIGNSTIYANTAVRGGGIYMAGGNLNMTHITLVDNRATGGDSLVVSGGTSRLRNSIIARTTSNGATRVRDCSASLDQAVSNLIQDGTCAATYSGDPGLASSPEGLTPSYYPLLAGSQAIGKGDASYCDDYPADIRGRSRPATGCDLGAYEYYPPSSRSGGSDNSASDASDALGDSSSKVVCTGEQLIAKGYRLSAAYGLCSGVQFQLVDQSGVGIQAVIDLGIVDSIDVWGYVDQGVEVCFTQSGYVVFLDAATSPRTVTTINPYLHDGYTCVTLNTAGTIVLTEQPLPTALGQAATAPGGALANCMVTTTHELNFRDGPAGMAIGNGIPNNATLTVLSRTTDWFEVDFMGIAGWISAAYIVTQGNCG